jgi:hypothetical protein
MEVGMNRVLRIFIVTGLVCVLIPAVAPSQSRVVTVEGLGNTKPQAIEQAKREAVATGIGMLLISETEIQDFQLKRDQIITRANGYVKDYRELSSSTEIDGTVRVAIEAEVTAIFDEMLKDQMALEMLLRWLKKPRFMVVLDENNMGDTGSIVAATEINRVLKEKGFDVVSEQQTKAILGNRETQMAIDGDPQAAMAIANQYQAEIIVTGRAKATKGQGMGQMLGNMTSGQAVISASMIRTDTGDILATSMAEGRKPHISPDVAGAQALTEAADKLTETLIAETIKGWGLEQSNERTVVIVVEGVEMRSQKTAIFHTMEDDIGFVKSVNQRQFGGGVLEAAVEITATTDDLADELDGRSFGDFRLVITAETPNTLTLKVVK